MEKNNIIVSLDLGTNSIHGVIVKINEDDKLEILSADTYRSDGVKNGVISDIMAAKMTIKKFYDKVIQEYKTYNAEAILAVRGALIDVIPAGSRIRIVNDNDETGTVTEETITLIEQRLSETNPIVDTKEIIEIIPQQYKIDEQVVQNPEQMIGKYLELKALMICGTKSNITNITQAADGGILKYGYGSIAETLVPNEDKDSGCILVDMGGMTTGIVVFVGGKIKDSFELPFGADYITRDIAAKLKITKKEATRIKENFGVILDEFAQDINSEIEYSTPNNQKQKIQLKDLISVIKPQVDLQLKEISKALIKRGIIANDFIGGFILTGGGSVLKGMIETFMKFFGTSLVKSANFTDDDFICHDDNIISSQVYTTALAILKSSLKNFSNSKVEDTKGLKVKNFFGWLKFFK